LTVVGVATFGALLASAIVSLPPTAPGLLHQVREQLPNSGTKSMVTAVLINFRGYDTLLELTVLLIAVLGVFVIRQGSRVVEPPPPSLGPLALEFIRVLAPFLVIFSGYFLWAGGEHPGGAFQAGAILGALGILLRLGGVLLDRAWSERTERLGLTIGVFTFAATGLVGLAGGGTFLTFPPAQASRMILLIEATGTLTIGLILVLLFVGGSLARPSPEKSAATPVAPVFAADAAPAVTPAAAAPATPPAGPAATSPSLPEAEP
jgi:multisubunit Na+/H+ antiporter MnhB subunit